MNAQPFPTVRSVSHRPLIARFWWLGLGLALAALLATPGAIYLAQPKAATQAATQFQAAPRAAVPAASDGGRPAHALADAGQDIKTTWVTGTATPAVQAYLRLSRTGPAIAGRSVPNGDTQPVRLTLRASSAVDFPIIRSVPVPRQQPEKARLSVPCSVILHIILSSSCRMSWRFI